ncbi:serine/threonine-protein kinase [Spongiactinospora rosea]|uniref:serine/threonine-protein kinase n=1 Tax=Spongiactinospora rosea TaxID=2248750 RepID=UPI000DEA2ECD|nr:serine/threonine-protein kinase [Spongiactinospora rosea]
MQAWPLSTEDPRRLGSFELVGRLGEGGQGVVYLGRGPAGEQVAVKLLHSGLTADEEARTRFLREVALAQRVARFCTAPVLHADLAGNRPYIVSEYVPGPSLRELVDREGPRRGGALERLAIATATALAAIHRAGILHRDLKPANVLMGPEGPVVIDFGIARALDAPGTTATGMAIGTPSYLAPEQLAGEPVSPASDVFAWGVTMVFAATGRPAFGQDSIPVVMNRILHSDPDMGDLTGPIRDVVAACLSKDPSLRPMAENLVGHLTGQTAGPLRTIVPGAEVPTGPLKTPRRGGRGKRPAVLVAALAAGVVVLGGGSVVLAKTGTLTLMADSLTPGTPQAASTVRERAVPPSKAEPPPPTPETGDWESAAPPRKTRAPHDPPGDHPASRAAERANEPASRRTKTPKPEPTRTPAKPTPSATAGPPEPSAKPTIKPTTKPTSRPTSRPSPTRTTASPKPQPKPNPHTPAGVCGSGYKVINSHGLGGGATVYLLYSAAAGRNCVVTMSKYVVPAKAAMSATLQVKGGGSAGDSGRFTAYAGPVRLAAAKRCVMWGGSFGSARWTSGWSHCG